MLSKNITKSVFLMGFILTGTFGMMGSAAASLDCAPGDTVCMEIRKDIFSRDWGYTVGRSNFRVSQTQSQFSAIFGPTNARIVDDRGTPATGDDTTVDGIYEISKDNQNRTHFIRLSTVATLPADAFGRTRHESYACDSYVSDPNACGFNVNNDFFQGFTNTTVNGAVTPAAGVVKRNLYYRSFITLGAGSRPILLALTQTFQTSTISTPLTGDFNNDGVVGLKDLSILQNQWGNPGTADLSGNGTVGSEDLAILLSHYGRRGTGSTKQRVMVHSETVDIPNSNGHHTDIETQRRTQFSIDEVFIDNVLTSKSGSVNVTNLANGSTASYTVVWVVDPTTGNVTETRVTRTSGGNFTYTGSIDPEDIHNRVSQPAAAASGALVQMVAKRAVNLEAAKAKDPRMVPVMAEKINGEDRRAKPTGD